VNIHEAMAEIAGEAERQGFQVRQTRSGMWHLRRENNNWLVAPTTVEDLLNTTAMNWTARVAATGALTDDQAEAVVTDGVYLVHWDDQAGTIEFQYHVLADNLTDAAVRAAEMWEAMSTVQQLVVDQTIGEPTQIVIRSDAHVSGAPYLSVAGVAERLGVSTARVRVLKDDLTFPAGVTVGGAAREVYDVAEIDTWARGREFAPKYLGRPREGDEQLLTEALATIRTKCTEPLMLDEDWRLQRAVEAQGGRYVRGKAKTLLDYLARHPHQRSALARYDGFTEAVTRAEEMWAER
jgi:hypothetical protein